MDSQAPNPSHIWHPFTQMKTAPPPLPVERGEKSWIHLKDGRKILDLISSWWVTVHGHAHPVLAEAIARQAAVLEQVIFAGFSHDPAEELAKRVADLLPDSLQKVFFSDDGSTSVEVAIKMAWQYYHNKGEARSRILALDGAYHGDTFGAMAVSERSVFTKAFDPLLFHVDFLPQPGSLNPVQLLQHLEKELEKGDVAALIAEPLIQGAGGMNMYSPALLQAMVDSCRKHSVLVIFDEIMTGFGRTGKMFAIEHLSSAPDIVCLSKGLTGGTLPLALTVSSEEIYQAFYSDERSHALLHGHSFTGNPISCAAANASLDLFALPSTWENIRRISDQLSFAAIHFSRFPQLEKVRSMGTVLAMDLKSVDQAGYFDRIGQEMYQYFLDKGLLIRLLGNVLYVLPPYCIEAGELSQALKDVEKGILELLPQ